jgi:hypothetical protein
VEAWDSRPHAPCVFSEAVIGHLDVAQDFPGLKLHGE